MSQGHPVSPEPVMDRQARGEEDQDNARPGTQQAKRRRQGGIVWHARWLLCNLGYRLVALGAWLEGCRLSRTTRRR
jgi:hypothetical protein